MTRLSVRLLTANAARAGMLALMTPVMTLTDRPLRGDDQVDADGTGLLGDAGDATPRRRGRPPSSGR